MVPVRGLPGVIACAVLTLLFGSISMSPVFAEPVAVKMHSAKNTAKAFRHKSELIFCMHAKSLGERHNNSPLLTLDIMDTITVCIER